MLTEQEISQNLFGFYRKAGKMIPGCNHFYKNLEYISMPDKEWPGFILGGDVPDKQGFSDIVLKINSDVLPPFWIRSLDDNPEFDNLASESGIRQIVNWKGMGLEMKDLFTYSADNKNVNLSVISKKEEIAEWISAVQKELLTGKKIIPELFFKLSLEEEADIFALRKNGRIVSTLLGYQENGIVGFYLVSTNREEGGKGYGTMISGFALNHYFRKGIRKFVLHSTVPGLRLYSKFGYTALCNYGVYWMVGKI